VGCGGRRRKSPDRWTAYFIGVFIIGIADLAFLFALVTPGIIELSVGSVSWPPYLVSCHAGYAVWHAVTQETVAV